MHKMADAGTSVWNNGYETVVSKRNKRSEYNAFHPYVTLICCIQAPIMHAKSGKFCSDCDGV